MVNFTTKLLLLASVSGGFYVYYKLQDARTQFKIRLAGGSAVALLISYELGVFDSILPSSGSSQAAPEVVVIEQVAPAGASIGDKLKWFSYGTAAGGLAALQLTSK